MSDLMSSLSGALNKTKNLFFGSGKFPMVNVKSSVDNQTYKVRDMPDKQEAADMMARIRLKMKKLKLHLEAKFPDKPQVQQLSRNFDAEAHRLGDAGLGEQRDGADAGQRDVREGGDGRALRHRHSPIRHKFRDQRDGGPFPA